jgi:hypothetical protein
MGKNDGIHMYSQAGAAALTTSVLRILQEAGLGRARVGPSRAREDCRPGLDPAAGVAGWSGAEEAGQHDSVKLYQHTSMVLDVQVTVMSRLPPAAQTNVPEPFSPAGLELKEGIPAGLSDAQATLLRPSVGLCC